MNLEAALRKAGVSREDSDDIIEARDKLAKTMPVGEADQEAVKEYLDGLDGEARDIAAQVLAKGGSADDVYERLGISSSASPAAPVRRPQLSDLAGPTAGVVPRAAERAEPQPRTVPK
jgi:hypothetical protein